MKKVQVCFQPVGIRGWVLPGKTVLEASRELGVGIESPCGGEGICGRCKVQILKGVASPLTEEETGRLTDSERLAGFRLACEARVVEDVTLLTPQESLTQAMVARKDISSGTVEVNPALLPYPVEMPPPTLQDLVGDLDRLQKALTERYGLPPLEVDPLALRKGPGVMREGDWKVTALVWMDRELLDVKPGSFSDCYGLAIDIGTTTVVGYLCHLGTGEVVATKSIMNPQVQYGEDVISRIHYATTHAEGTNQLHRVLIEGLNQLIEASTEEARLSTEEIFEVTVVGNTLMHHLFLGLDPRYLGVSPFAPALNRSLDLKARELGLRVHPSANVHLLPVKAGFVGADNIAVLIAERPFEREELTLIIDVGTNGELVLGNRERLLSTSCATGPALEGAHIKFGMRAALGAIERVRIEPGSLEVDYKVIGEETWKTERTRAKGLCGSGIVDAVAELFRCGVIEESGQFKRTLSSSRLKFTAEGPEFVIAWKEETSHGREVTITQQDVRNVQLAKAALYAGAKVMMKKLGVEAPERVVLAGAFGSYIDPEKAMILGMIPDCDLKRVFSVGNAAGEGARIALLNRERRREAGEIARRVEYLELTLEPDFQKEFIEAMPLPHLRDPFPHVRGLISRGIPDLSQVDLFK
ncbi:MAG: ASKHA domain-containing protein [Desulfobacterota bacterium]|nr:ASKHA domain-containing protein [Thermodesulfobacteriota bacterium]